MVWPICVAVAGTAALSFLLTGIARRFAPGLGLMDRPDGYRKKHQKPVPLMGGAAMYCALLAVFGFVWEFGDGWLEVRSGVHTGIPILLLSGGLFCVLGLVDDKRGMRARHKFLWQIVASLPFAVWGRSIDSLEFASVHVHVGLWGVVFTVLWLVACSNIINLVDGLDGLAGTVSLIMAIGIAALAVLTQRYGIAVFSLMLAGSILGFLIHNWPPAKIFMGDSGSLTLGFLIGALSIEASMKKAAGFMLIVPLVLISIPVYDTLMAILRRKLTGKSIAQADRGHIHHRLQDRGLTRVQCLLAIAALCVVMATIALVSAYTRSDILAVSLCTAVLALLTAGRIFGHDEASLLFRHINAINTLIIANLRAWPSRMLAARLRTVNGGHRADFWEKLCQRVARMGGGSIELVCADPHSGRVIDRLNWTHGNESADGSAITPLLPQTAMDQEAITSTRLQPQSVRPPSTLSPATQATAQKPHFDPLPEGLTEDAFSVLLDEGSSSNSWEFRYSIRQSDSLQTTLIAYGRGPERSRTQQLADLFRLFDTFCRHWSVVELAKKDAKSVASMEPLPKHGVAVRAAAPPTEYVDEKRRAA